MSFRWMSVRRRSVRNLFFHLGSVASVAALLINFIPDFDMIPSWGYYTNCLGNIPHYTIHGK